MVHISSKRDHAILLKMILQMVSSWGPGTLGAGWCQPVGSHTAHLIKKLNEITWDYWTVIQICWGKSWSFLGPVLEATGRNLLIRGLDTGAGMCQLWSTENVQAPGCRAAFAQDRFTGCSWSTLAKTQTDGDGRWGNQIGEKSRFSYRKERVGFHVKPFIFDSELLTALKPISSLLTCSISRSVVASGKY